LCQVTRNVHDLFLPLVSKRSDPLVESDGRDRIPDIERGVVLALSAGH